MIIYNEQSKEYAANEARKARIRLLSTREREGSVSFEYDSNIQKQSPRVVLLKKVFLEI